MLNLPILDDLRHADLMAEARALLPTLAPSWTDHNPSDPGIMLVELLAWLTEMVLYRVDQVPERSTWAFLRLLNAPGWERPADGDLEAAIRSTLRELRTPYRAVTCEEFEQLAWRWRDASEARAHALRRVHCLAERDLEGSTPEAPAPGHVSVIVVRAKAGLELPGEPSPDVRDALKELFDQRRLLTTRCHVVGPRYQAFTVHATLYLRPEARAPEVRAAASRTVLRYLHPLHGGPNGQGWPFGQSVHVSDLVTLLSGVQGVEFVGVEGDAQLTLAATSPARALPDGGVRLVAHELPVAAAPESHFTMRQQVRGTWRPAS
ncbi:baseplate J/gp47 family protein [Pyxidicoccus sp. 3LFB2]